MKIPPLTFPCGCKAEPTEPDKTLLGVYRYVLHHCPLHGAAGELRDVVSELVSLTSVQSVPPGYFVMQIPRPLMRDAIAALQAALASAEPKPATEGKPHEGIHATSGS